ncbi:MAG: hypothetical protein WAT39_11695, partial [Planctomycetota bacterium]
LLRGFDAFGAGFLAVAAADCAVEVGDHELAERLLAHAHAGGLPDPWQRELAVRAALLYERGETAVAEARIRTLLQQHGSPSARRRLARWLVARGAIDEASVHAPYLMLPRDAPLVAWIGELWWSQQPVAARLAAVVAAATHPAAHLAWLAPAQNRAESTTRRAGASSSRVPFPNGDGPDPEDPMPAASATPSSARIPFAVCRWTRLALAAPSAHDHRALRRAFLAGAWCIDELGGAGRLAGMRVPGILLLGLTMAAAAVEPRAQVQWTQLSPAVAPSARSTFGTASDLTRNRIVLFGGVNNGAFPGDTWEWDGATWSLRSTSGPASRYGPQMAFDIARNRTVMFGGVSYTGSPLGDTGDWDGTTWTQRSPATSPPPRGRGGMAYDRSRQRVVLFGGWDGGQRNDTWEWDGTNWVDVSPALRPGPRFETGMAFDAVRNRCVVFGGFDPASSFGLYNDTWLWDGTSWVQAMPPVAPPARSETPLAFDELRGRIVLYGGVGGPWPTSIYYLADVWEWDGSTWLQRGTGPGVRLDHGLAYDAVLQRLICFGGWTTMIVDETWSYGPTNPAGFTTFGTACAGTAGTPALTCPALPWLGDTMTVQVAPVPVVALPFFVIGFSNTFSAFGPLPVNLTILGLTNCFLNVSLDVFELVPNLVGSAQWSLAIPNNPTLLGAQLHLQGGTSDLAANPFGAVLSGGATVTVGAR